LVHFNIKVIKDYGPTQLSSNLFTAKQIIKKFLYNNNKINLVILFADGKKENVEKAFGKSYFT